MLVIIVVSSFSLDLIILNKERINVTGTLYCYFAYSEEEINVVYYGHHHNSIVVFMAQPKAVGPMYGLL